MLVVAPAAGAHPGDCPLAAIAGAEVTHLLSTAIS